MLKEEQIKCIKISPLQIKAGINYMRWVEEEGVKILFREGLHERSGKEGE